MKVESFRLYGVQLPFRNVFRHAKKARETSSSLFLECRLEDATVGFGETLPRQYVTGETQDAAFAFLRDAVLPRLIGKEFSSLADLHLFLTQCDGSPPIEWQPIEQRQSDSEPNPVQSSTAFGSPTQGGARHTWTAAWCAVDLALLDAFGRHFKESIKLGADPQRPELGERSNFGGGPLRYSGVLTMGNPLKVLAKALRFRVFGFNAVKVKLGAEIDRLQLRALRAILGSGCEVRVDANMAWTMPKALEYCRTLQELGIRAVEQPVEVAELGWQSELVKAGYYVVADESITTRASLDALIANGACRAANIRISKCGGLVASAMRAREALAAGFDVQLGCQVGESSVLSAAQLRLLQALPQVSFLEGCFGHYLLKEDPALELLQFGPKGAVPEWKQRAGISAGVDTEVLRRYQSHYAEVK